MKKAITYLVLVLIFIVNSHAFAENDKKLTGLDYIFFEFDGKINSSKTDFYFDPQEGNFNYFFVKQDAKLGYRLLPALFNMPKGIALDVYLNSHFKTDVLGKEFNKFDWNNFFTYGPGIRLKVPFKTYFDADFVKDINLDVFAEYLRIAYLPKVQSSTVHRPKQDLIFGVSLWSSFEVNPNISLFNSIWAEIGAGYSYRRSNLYINDVKGFNIINASAILGSSAYRKKIDENNFINFIDPYFKTFLEWDMSHSYDWNNNLKYGFGINLIKFKHSENGNSSYLAKNARCEIFFEYLRIGYLNNVSYIPGYRPNNDLSFGIRYYLLLGGKGIK